MDVGLLGGGGSMSLEVKGGVELRDDVARMADLLRASGGKAISLL